MKATESSLLQLLSGPRQFVIPIYQRTYSWHQAQCVKLLHDIEHINTDTSVPGHFIGSVVYFQESVQNVTGIPQLLVIDGQQRLTTISLLIAALAAFVTETETEIETSAKKLRNYYLFNSDEDGELHYKLLLTRRDKDTIKAILKGLPLPEKHSQRIIENYNFFRSKITSANAAKIYNGIQRLFVVDVALERGKDNPQRIFESLNSTGLDLSQADLIRNYILMGQSPDVQSDLYERYWYPMEVSYGNEYISMFNKFMRDYLSAKTGTIPNIDRVYDEFKSFAENEAVSDDITELVKDIYGYSGFYANMVLHTPPEPALKRAFQSLSRLQVAVAYPFLLPVYADYTAGSIVLEEFVEIISLIENYVFRRAICGIPTNSLNKTFLTLYRSIKPANYMQSVRAAFVLLDSYKRFPTDSEFINCLLTKDVYNFRSRNYLLSRLENYKRKEPVAIDEYTIEHILPQNQNLSTAWRAMLGEQWKEIQQKYLHTLGNLTLTAYNSELSDDPFPDKKKAEGGFDHSPIRLNDYLRDIDVWNEQHIQTRAFQLAAKAAVIWPRPELNDEELEPYVRKETQTAGIYTIDNYEYLRGEMRTVYETLRKRILNIDSSVKEEYKKLYIAFKSSTNFVDIVPQKARLRLSLNMDFEEIIDPRGVCKDVTGLGRWGNGNVEFGISSTSEIDYGMELIQQAFDLQMESA